MIDVNLIRQTPEIVRDTIRKKFQDHKLKLVDEVIKKDSEWRTLKKKTDDLRAERNAISKKIGDAKKNNKPAGVFMKQAKKIPSEIEKIEKKAEKIQAEIHKILTELPNIINPAVPIGKDASENKEIRQIGKPREFDFEVKSHVEIGEALGCLDFESSAKASGNGFYYMQGDIALLNQALLRFAIDKMISNGFLYVETPLMLRGNIINNVVDLHDQKNQIYKINDDDLYMIGTSEHSLIGRYIDTILQESQLPIKQTSYSMCFRKEIGSHGIDEKGLYRTHQFNKIEMVSICKPEDSMKLYEEMQNITVEIFKELGIPIRVLAICSGDMGDLKHIQVDIEAWSPRKKEYFEVASCSNLTDAQARRLMIRCDGPKGRYAPHTLNNTALASSRALVAILENNQQKDGTVTVPHVLVPYMQGKKTIGHVKHWYSFLLK